MGVEGVDVRYRNITKPCDVIKIRDYPPLFRGFLSQFSSHLPLFYDVTWLIFETLCKVTDVSLFYPAASTKLLG